MQPTWTHVSNHLLHPGSQVEHKAEVWKAASSTRKAKQAPYSPLSRNSISASAVELQHINKYTPNCTNKETSNTAPYK